jgi:hypothetical protein
LAAGEDGRSAGLEEEKGWDRNREILAQGSGAERRRRRRRSRKGRRWRARSRRRRDWAAVREFLRPLAMGSMGKMLKR